MSDELSIKLYQSISEDNKPREVKAWHASSLAQCPRALYFERKGIKGLPLNAPTAAKILRWGAGHILETKIRPHIAKLYKDVTSNKRIYNKKLDLSGEYDNYSKEQKTLIEIKSVHDYAIKYRKVSAERDHLKDEKPYLHHEIQNHAYAILLKEQPKFIDYVYITLSGRLCTYHTEVQPELIRWVKSRLGRLNEAWEEQEPPECQCNEDNPLYAGVLQWCDYKTEDGCCDLKLIDGVKNEASNE